MTVQELMIELAKHPPDQRVLVDGYEGGYDDPHLYEHKFHLDVRPEGYLGTHDTENGAGGYDELKPAVPCLLISRSDYAPR